MLTSPTIITALLPPTEGLRLAHVTHTNDEVTATLVATRPAVPCPQTVAARARRLPFRLLTAGTCSIIWRTRSRKCCFSTDRPSARPWH